MDTADAHKRRSGMTTGLLAVSLDPFVRKRPGVPTHCLAGARQYMRLRIPSILEYSGIGIAEDRIWAAVEYGLWRTGRASLTLKPEQLVVVAGY